MDENLISQFDADVSPDHENNIKAAKEHKLRYDPVQQVYVDEDGCVIRDQFGQTF